jgi:hypothetical protein
LLPSGKRPVVHLRLALAVKYQDVDGSPRFASARSPPEMRQIFSDWRLAN